MKFICLHHTAVKNTGSPQLWAVDRYHKNKWNMISKYGWYVGYNYFCDTDGRRTQTRALNEETIANRGHNCDVPARCDAISYCMAGDFRVETPNKKQEDDFWKFLREMRRLYPDIIVVGHRELQKDRTCPELPQDYIDKFNKESPKEDTEKEEIADLYSQLDFIRSLLIKLMNKLRL